MAQTYVSIMDKIKRIHDMKNALPCMEFDYSINPYLGFWYAEDRLYLLCDCMVGAYYFVEADSPYKAIEKVLKRVDEAMHAGEPVNEDMGRNEVKQMTDYIDRQAAIDAFTDAVNDVGVLDADDINTVFQMLPSAQPEPLTDREQRIFLAAMGREEKVCEKVDRNYVREPYEDSLMQVCKEIRRKVKGALWT